MCNNRICCNPLHLKNGTQADNVRDRDQSGRGKWHSGSDHSNSKLNPALAMQVLDLIAHGFSQIEIASIYGIGQTTVSRIKMGNHWAVGSSTKV